MYTIVLILLSVKSVFCANILYVASIPSPSHHIWNRILALELVSKGHNVTLVDPDPEKASKPTNYSHIQLDGVYDALQQSVSVNELATYSTISTIYIYQDWCLFSCSKTVKSEGLRNLLNYPPDFKFDLIIVDVTTGSCLYPLIHRFNYPPSIAVTGFLLPSYVSYNFGNHFHPTYIPWYGLPYSPNMNFVERLLNFVFMHVDTYLRYVRQYELEHKLVKQVFGENIPSMEKFERHMSLVLTNIDPILDYPQPLAPNFIPVGGLQTRESGKLPQDLKTLLDSSKNGVVLFSLGTNVRSDKLDKSKQKALLDAFRQIPQTVIWKFESDIDNLPKNVMTMKWLPQNDILGHPNVKLFIGHGGTLSTQEAIFHGVPMICVPFIVDQYVNAKMLVNKKLGIFLDFNQISTDYVLQKLKEVLDNPEYSENMKKMSKLFKDRKETPLERAVFWIEYVIRNGGAHFLNTPARDFSYLKASGLDIVAFLALIVVFIFILFYKVISLILRQYISKRKIKVN